MKIEISDELGGVGGVRIVTSLPTSYVVRAGANRGCLVLVRGSLESTTCSEKLTAHAVYDVRTRSVENAFIAIPPG